MVERNDPVFLEEAATAEDEKPGSPDRGGDSGKVVTRKCFDAVGLPGRRRITAEDDRACSRQQIGQLLEQSREDCLVTEVAEAVVATDEHRPFEEASFIVFGSDSIGHAAPRVGDRRVGSR